MGYKFNNNSPIVPNNLWFRYTNDPLKQILKTKYITSPIATNEAESDPRLLVIAVDVQQGETVAFEGYPDMRNTTCRICRKPCNDNKDLVNHVFNHTQRNSQGDELRWSVYGNERDGKKNAIFYNQGLDVEHILASASVPVNYDYAKLESIEFSYDPQELSIKDENEQLFKIESSMKF